MSMLAESRSREKWSDDPRNTRWASDKSKFGYQMLTKMGWCEGSGLGQTLQGQTSHIKIKKKRNGHGIGMKTSHDDDWIAHQDSFNALLTQLNGGGGTGEGKKIQSLEERVRISKTKIMYSRFVKSKDLSRASSEDLASIFGQRSKSAPATPQLSEDEDGNQSDVSTASCPTQKKINANIDENDQGFKTINSGLSVADYFAQKMAAMKQNKLSKLNNKDTEKVISDEDDEEKCKKKKKKKKQKVMFDIFEKEEEEIENCTDQKNDDEEEVEEETKIKKKKKHKKKQTIENEKNDVSPEEENNGVEGKKKKKKRKDNKTTERSQETVICEKKTFTRERVDDEAVSSSSPPPSDTPPKKKKKKQKQENDEEPTVTKKTKKKKRKHEGNEDGNGVDSSGEERKRKRKKRHQSDDDENESA